MSTADKNITGGFIDGYMAGNIAANENEFKQHIGKIIDLVVEIRLFLSKSLNNQEVVDNLSKAIDKLKDIAPLHDAEIEDYNGFGDEFSSLCKQIKESYPPNQIPTDIMFNLKRAIYHFLLIARRLKAERLIEVATEVAKQFVN